MASGAEYAPLVGSNAHAPLATRIKHSVFGVLHVMTDMRRVGAALCQPMPSLHAHWLWHTHITYTHIQVTAFGQWLTVVLTVLDHLQVMYTKPLRRGVLVIWAEYHPYYLPPC